MSVPRKLRLQVRDANLRVVAPIDHYLEAEFVPKFNPVSLETCGTFMVRLPTRVNGRSYRAASALLEPGAGVVASLDGVRFFSGLVEEPERAREGSGGAVLTVFGYSDDSLVAVRNAWQVPTAVNPDGQGAVAYDVRRGVVEVVVKGYVTANAGPAAPNDGRRVPGLTVVETVGGGIGSVVTGRARMHNLAGLVSGLCVKDGLGWRVLDAGGSLRFEVYQPRDRSRHARFSPALRNLQSFAFSTPKATVTRAIVAAGGEGRARNYDQVTSPAVWHQFREVVVDQRQVDALDDYWKITKVSAGLLSVQNTVTGADYSELITFISTVRQGIFNGQHTWAVRASQVSRIIVDTYRLARESERVDETMGELASLIGETVDEVTANEWGDIRSDYAAVSTGPLAGVDTSLRAALLEAEKDAPAVTVVTDALTAALTSAQAADAANDTVAGRISSPYRADYATSAEFRWEGRVGEALLETQQAGVEAVEDGAATPSFAAPVQDTPAVRFLRDYGPLDRVTVTVEGVSVVDVVRQVSVKATPEAVTVTPVVGVPDRGPSAALVRRLRATERRMARIERSL